MTGPSLYDQYVASQKPSTGSLYDQYVASKGGTPQTTADRLHAEFKAGTLGGRMARENANDADQADAETPDYGTQVMGGIASLGRDIPGVEALQSGARALAKREPYSVARDEIRGAEADAPSMVRNYNRIAGSVVGGAAIPSQMGGKTLTPAMQAALFGGASGVLQSDPNAGVGDRAKSGAIGAGVGAVAGKAGEAMTNVVRALASKSLGAQALARKATMATTDAQNYGAAAAEGAANGGTSPAIQQALAAPDIAPFVEVVKQSRTLQGADDATVLREAYKLMSERQGSLQNRIINANDFKAGTSLENKDIGAAKQQLLTAAEAPPTNQGIQPSAAYPTLANVKQNAQGFFVNNAAGRAYGNTQQDALAAAQEQWQQYGMYGNPLKHPSFPGDDGYLYHYTPASRVANIAQNGLRAGEEGVQRADVSDAKNFLYAFKGTSPEWFENGVARDAQTDEPWAILRFKEKTPWAADPEFTDGTPSVRAQMQISPADIEAYRNGGWNPITGNTSQAANAPHGVMPSLRTAIEQHADLSGQRDAMRQGADATKRLLNGTQVAGKKLETNSPEAFMAAIRQMAPDDARAALQGVMGRTQQGIGLNANPFKGFGVGSSLSNGSQVAPYVRALDQQSGGAPSLVDLIRAYFAAQGHPSP